MAGLGNRPGAGLSFASGRGSCYPRGTDLQGRCMVFSSIAFLFYFLPLFLLAYFALPFRNAVFLVFSLIFYTLGEGPHLFLLLACVAYNHRFAILIENESAKRGPGSKRWISIAIAVNLGVLGLFKYGGFLMAQLAPAIHLFG